MVSKKGKRKMEYKGRTFYWFIRKNSEGIAKIHILSEDKKVHLEYFLLNREVPVVSSYVKKLLEDLL